MRLALVSDAWAPQVNGVVRTLATTVALLRRAGHAVDTLTPDQFPTVPCPSYPEIRLAIRGGKPLRRRMDRFRPDAIHIATEGPLGWAARRWCRSNALPFTTSFHTRFPDYLSVRTGLSTDLFWPLARRFHGAAERTFAATATLERELASRGIARTHRWSRGVDTALFTPDGPLHAAIAHLPHPILLCVGRVAPEKNLEAFLDLKVPGSKVVVGGGPSLAALRSRYRDTAFLGPLTGEELAGAYRTADVLVFPSRTDTFGLVMIEALASGTPVAAFPVPGPLDVLADRAGGALDEDLAAAIARALPIGADACTRAARSFDWDWCVDQFLSGLAPVGSASATKLAA